MVSNQQNEPQPHSPIGWPGRFGMLAWTARRREIARQAEDNATTLISEHGAGAYAEARRRQQDAINAEDVARWRHAAIAIAKRTGKRIALDTATRMATDADMTATPDVAAPFSPAAPPHEIDPQDEMSATIARGERWDR